MVNLTTTTTNTTNRESSLSLAMSTTGRWGILQPLSLSRRAMRVGIHNLIRRWRDWASWRKILPLCRRHSWRAWCRVVSPLKFDSGFNSAMSSPPPLLRNFESHSNHSGSSGEQQDHQNQSSRSDSSSYPLRMATSSSRSLSESSPDSDWYKTRSIVHRYD